MAGLNNEVTGVHIQFKILGEPEIPEGIRDLKNEAPNALRQRIKRKSSGEEIWRVDGGVNIRGFNRGIVFLSGFSLADAWAQVRAGVTGKPYTVFCFTMKRVATAPTVLDIAFTKMLEERWDNGHAHLNESDGHRWIGVRFNLPVPYPKHYALGDVDEWGIRPVINTNREVKAAAKAQKASV